MTTQPAIQQTIDHLSKMAALYGYSLTPNEVVGGDTNNQVDVKSLIKKKNWNKQDAQQAANYCNMQGIGIKKLTTFLTTHL
jgi:hypothetical protein